MKMKELSALTGISDRTIRYYIDDGLFIPEKYTENYEGRRSYDFSENDVKHLKQIALLRKYGFSISDIKEIENGDSEIGNMLQARIESAKQNSEAQMEDIKVLESVIEKKPDSIDALCEMLSNPVIEQAPIPSIDEQSAYKPMYDRIKKRIKIITVIILVIILCHYIVFPLCVHLISQSEIGGNIDQCWVNYVPSEIHSQKEIDEAISHVIKRFALSYEDCTLLEIEYAGDERCVNESDYSGFQNSKNTIVIDCKFETGSTASYVGFENNCEYTWSFTLKRMAGKWFIVNYGQA